MGKRFFSNIEGFLSENSCITGGEITSTNLFGEIERKIRNVLREIQHIAVSSFRPKIEESRQLDLEGRESYKTSHFSDLISPLKSNELQSGK